MRGHTKLVWQTDFGAIRVAIAESQLGDRLDSEAVDRLASFAVRRSFAADEVIVRHEDLDESLLVLASGRAEICAVTDEPLYYLKPGMVFGEVALLDEKPRSATVRAIEDCEVVLIPADDLRMLIDTCPQLGLSLLKTLARVLCSRVRASNQQIAALLTIDELREK